MPSDVSGVSLAAISHMELRWSLTFQADGR
jgi:hypothetical protein